MNHVGRWVPAVPAKLIKGKSMRANVCRETPAPYR